MYAKMRVQNEISSPTMVKSLVIMSFNSVANKEVEKRTIPEVRETHEY